MIRISRYVIFKDKNNHELCLLCNSKNEQYQDKIKNNIKIIFREF